MEAGCRLTASATPPSQVLDTVLAEPHTCHSGARGEVEKSQRRYKGCARQELASISPCPLSHCVQPDRERAGKPLCHASIIRNSISYRILKADFERVIYIKYRTILRNPSTFQLILLWFETKKNTFAGKSILGLFLLKATSS